MSDWTPTQSPKYSDWELGRNERQKHIPKQCWGNDYKNIEEPIKALTTKANNIINQTLKDVHWEETNTSLKEVKASIKESIRKASKEESKSTNGGEQSRKDHLKASINAIFVESIIKKGDIPLRWKDSQFDPLKWIKPNYFKDITGNVPYYIPPETPNKTKFSIILNHEISKILKVKIHPDTVLTTPIPYN